MDYGAGHGLDASLDQRVETAAHVYAFLMHHLGMPDTGAPRETTPR